MSISPFPSPELLDEGIYRRYRRATEENGDYRRVLYTGKQLQLVLMSLAPGEEIGEEVHETGDQFFCVEKGKGEVLIDGKRTKIKGDDIYHSSWRTPQRDQQRPQAVEVVYSL